MYISDIAKGRDNNLDLIRFVAAIMVIFSHAFPLSLGEGNADYLSVLTHGQIDFGGAAVSIFFFYGGFLICKSAHRLQSVGKYFKARIIRIFPPIIVVTVLLTFVMGPVVSGLGVGEYFTNPQTYKYLLNSVLVLVHDLPGVFENNIYGRTVNGPLWTMPVEFFGYILCFLMMKIGMLQSKCTKWILPIFVFVHIAVIYFFPPQEMVLLAWRPTALFFVGMVYYVYRDKIKISREITWASIILLLISFLLGIGNFTIILFWPYVLMYLGFGTKLKFKDFAKYGEISYGIYLCGWPIQQIVCQQFGGSMKPGVNAAISIPIAIVCGFLINKCVEKPIMKRLG